jgi:hypothetical protein
MKLRHSETPICEARSESMFSRIRGRNSVHPVVVFGVMDELEIVCESNPIMFCAAGTACCCSNYHRATLSRFFR